MARRRKYGNAGMAYVPEDFLKPSPVREITSKEIWYQETGPQAFEVGVSRRSLPFLAVGLIFCTLVGFQFGGTYRNFARHAFNFDAFFYFLQHITGLFVGAGIAAMSIWGKTTVTVNGNDAVAFHRDRLHRLATPVRLVPCSRHLRDQEGRHLYRHPANHYYHPTANQFGRRCAKKTAGIYAVRSPSEIAGVAPLIRRTGP